MSYVRVATANAFERTVQNINRRQAELAQTQEQLSSGKRVLRASDDAVAATLAERAQNRIARTEADLKALESSRTALAQAESGLAEADEIMHRVRELVVQAGDPVLTASSRADLARQIEGLREQMLAVANRTDTNGITLFGGLGGAEKPFADVYGPNAGVSFQGQNGQYAATEDSLPHTVNGHSIWMRVAQGSGVVMTELNQANQGDVTGVVTVNTPATLPVPAPTYRVDFYPDPAITTTPRPMKFNIMDATTGAAVLTDQDYDPSAPPTVTFAAGAGDFQLTLSGNAQAGDSLYLDPGTVLPENYTVTADAGNLGQAWSDQGTVVDATALTGDRYAVEYLDGPNGVQFRVMNLSSGGEVVPPTDYVEGKSVTFDGLQLKLSGAPSAGDRITVQSSETGDLFQTLQNVIDALRYGGPNQAAELTHEIGRGLNELDTGLDRILDARGRLGEWLNRADSMENLFTERQTFQANEKSQQEDLDMVKGISDFQSQQVGLQAALQSYAQVQKLSLFQYIA